MFINRAHLDGKLAVDAGCGTGRHLDRLGICKHVHAVDFSSGMIEIAKAKHSHSNITYHVSPIDDMEFISNNSVDFVLCSLVGEHLEDLDRVFGTFHRVLFDGGTVLFSVYHPFMAFKGVEAHFVREESDADNNVIKVDYCLGANQYLMSDYYNAMIRAGFKITEFSEYVVNHDFVERHDYAKKYLGTPVLAVLMATK